MGREAATSFARTWRWLGNWVTLRFFANRRVQIINYFGAFLSSVEATEGLLEGPLLRQPWEHCRGVHGGKMRVRPPILLGGWHYE